MLVDRNKKMFNESIRVITQNFWKEGTEMGKRLRFVALMVFVLVFTIACGSGEDTAENLNFKWVKLNLNR